ncbi:DUF732 domain-containing protein [Tomitella biformata]|uniref:DUF732 domain-containing protein n=1 Tax=Tomitella biformata TaxID=630403 RepID=UPI0004B607FF|nr:DUF732 domain-containing protein [Tomitella biformata]
MRPRHLRAVLAGAAASCALAACSSPVAVEVAPAIAPSASAQDAAALGSKAQNSAEQDNLEQIGAAYAAALADGGLSLPPTSNHSTLAQVARGICSQLAAGTSESEIRAQLQPFSLFAVSQAVGDINEAQAGQAYLDAARTHIC